MIDSDGYAQEEGSESSWMTTANPINLSSEDAIVLQFETWYRAFNNEACFVVVNTSNKNWPELNAQFDATTDAIVNIDSLLELSIDTTYTLSYDSTYIDSISVWLYDTLTTTNYDTLTTTNYDTSYVDVFEVFPDISELETNPELMSINISNIAAGQDSVWIRFHWTGTFGYSWFIDDAAINQLQPNDIVLNYGYVSGGGPVEYRRIPESQISDTLTLGGEVLNFGSQDQINVTEELSIVDVAETSSV
jgi:hypothetical protein